MAEKMKAVGDNLVPKDSNGLGIAGFVLGIFSLFLGPLGVILGVVSLILCIIQVRRNNSGLAVAGIVISVIAILIGVIIIFLVAFVWSSIIPQLNDELDRGIVCLDVVSQISLLDEGNTCYDSDNSIVNVEVAYRFEHVDLVGIRVLFSDSLDDDNVEVRSGLPLPGSKAVLSVPYSGDFDLEGVRIAPIISVDGVEQTCDASYKLELKEC